MARATLARVEVARALGAGYAPDAFLGDDAGVVPEAEDAVAPMSRRRMLWLSGSAVAAAAVGAVGIGLWGRGERYATRRGEMLRIALPDGSIVNLNTASSIDVRFSEAQRTIVLEGGEVLFDVAKDAKRPFVVLAGRTRVQAIGTEFTVRHERRAPVNIIVSEGVVEVTQADAAVQPVRLSQNMQAKADPDAVSPIEAVDVTPDAVARQLFWREGKIGFSDATLAAAAAEFARYNDGEIVIPDPEVAQQRVTGLFVATDPKGFAEAVATSFGLQARVDGDRIILTPS